MAKIFNTEGKYIKYIDEGPDRMLWYGCGCICKRDSLRLGESWKAKMEAILKMWNVPGFYGFIENGYTTKYVDGFDLQGNKPFEMDGNKVDVVVSNQLKLEVLELFGNAIRVGKALGFTFGDITCGNIFTDGQKLYLIDYDVIVPYPLSEEYESVWKNTLNLLIH